MSIISLSILATLPIFGWGFMPVIAKQVGASAKETMFGTTIIVFILTGGYAWFSHQEFTIFPFFISICSGLLWGIGQWLQFEAIQMIDVSKAMPISNGSQLVFTSCIAWLLLGEWIDGFKGIVSVIALIFIVFGIVLATHSSSKVAVPLRGLLVIVASSVALAAYVSLPKFFGISGWGIFFPQSVGMLLMASLLIFPERQKVDGASIGKNFLTGVFWLVANTSLFIVSQEIGLGLSFTISQMCVVVSILGGVVILKDEKNSQEKKNLAIGTLIMVAGLFLFGMYK